MEGLERTNLVYIELNRGSVNTYGHFGLQEERYSPNWQNEVRGGDEKLPK